MSTAFAALDLRQHLRTSALGAGLAIRMGAHSGPVVVGELGSAAQGHITIVGTPTQGALRLQQQAVPGTLLVSRPQCRRTVLYPRRLIPAPTGTTHSKASSHENLRQNRRRTLLRAPQSAGYRSHKVCSRLDRCGKQAIQCRLCDATAVATNRGSYRRAACGTSRSWRKSSKS